jgi:DamX protein
MLQKFVWPNLKGHDCLSELQERLEHLVNYSSQLIFVSGDSIAQQQRTLDAFLSMQKENTEISYFTSELSMESPDFRRIICRQLLGQKVGSFVRPLKELLKDLHEQPGPYLLCIKQAQTLPNAFLQELWDWVTESKAQSQNHHVNVILFGETAWAEKAKSWLPKRNSSRPVLLSTQSIDSTKFDVNALESLMAEERPSFSLALFRRDEFSPPIVTQKWFIVSILVLLLSVFIGLMSWQYPDHVKSLLQTGTLPPEAQLNTDKLALLNEQLDREVKTKGQTKEEFTDSSLSKQESMQLSTPKEIQFKLHLNSTKDKPQLITSWDDAKQTSNDKIKSLKENINGQQTAQDGDAALITNLDEVTPIASDDVIDADEADGDFAVPDIISVEQLDATLGNQLLTPSQEEQLAIDTLASEDTLSTVPEQAAAQEKHDLRDNRLYEFDEAMLLALPEPGVLLQLSGIQNRRVLNEFIVDNQLQDLIWVYQTTRYGAAWHVVLLNQRFTSLNATRQAVELLPSSLQSTQPFAKDLEQIKLEIRNR